MRSNREGPLRADMALAQRMMGNGGSLNFRIDWKSGNPFWCDVGPKFQQLRQIVFPPKLLSLLNADGFWSNVLRIFARCETFRASRHEDVGKHETFCGHASFGLQARPSFRSSNRTDCCSSNTPTIGTETRSGSFCWRRHRAGGTMDASHGWESHRVLPVFPYC